MPDIKHIEFSSLIAFHEWKRANYPFVAIISTSIPDVVIDDMVSRRIPRPKIKVTYQEYPKEYPL